ncbi:tetratricopeptide repeat protein [Isachenkonia alkalipeptolytica]|uniref:Tetratricopeptide repeat protein n=1 Tax=Isachenkonia alkalipeptolytica TaxID=2565777 RepID=A0AA43XNV5_9CLOT|nr:tetratricopeptide repeat protein [Isachenkonia alkalipeptolytica]NBG89604.1 tetratricopeptide repeat protein [Isachenkonia alkalipeptolytica]
MKKQFDNPYLQLSEPKSSLDFLSNLEERKSSFYPLQSLLGVLGVILIFLSFRDPLYFFIGAGLLFLRVFWRKKSDPLLSALQQSKLYYRKKRFDKCLASLDRLIEEYPNNHGLKLIQGECYLHMNRLDEAYNVYKNAFEQSPESFSSETSQKHMVYLLFLIVHFRDFQLGERVAEFYRVKNNSEFFIVLWSNYYLGIIHYFNEDQQRALKHFKKVYNLNSDFKNIPELLKKVKQQENIETLL